MNTFTFSTYAYLASALINGDCSGLDDNGLKELEALRSWLKDQGISIGQIVSCSDEEYFTWNPDFGGLGGTCLEYTALIK